MQLDDQTREEAVSWAVRTGDPAFTDWEAFEAWLESSPEHALAYDRVAASVSNAAEALRVARPVAANDEVPQPAFVTRRWFGGAIAASLAAVLFYFVWPGSSTYVEETRPGETVMIALGDGSRIDLAGGTRIELDRNDQRFARLERGRALFTVRHDEARPFRVLAGDDTLLDVGTVFDVTLGEESLSVAVGEGAVMFNPARQKVRLGAGDALRSARSSDAFEQGKVAAARVGEWRDGRLTFDDASLADAAAQLEQMTGIRFRAADGNSTRISGSIVISPVREDPRAAGALLGVPIRREGETWMLGAS